MAEQPTNLVMHFFKLSLMSCALACGVAQAQALVPASAGQATAPSKEVASPNGTSRMMGLMDAIKRGKVDSLPAQDRRAVQSGLTSGAVAADTSRMDPKTVQFSVEQAQKWEQMAREAYVAALPPRDRALGASVLLGDGTDPGGAGTLYIFVSRSMPPSLLRAYAIDAFYLGAELVVKGLRKGDTLKEYVAEAMEQFNSLEGQSLAGMEINPNLFDMFDVQLVPAVVWTGRVGLDDIGSGCQNVPEGTPLEQLSLTGPDDTMIQLDRPTCAKQPESSYYKLSGALTLPYVLDRFQEAGLSKKTVDELKARLAVHTGNVHDGSVQQGLGNAMAPVSHHARLDRLPPHVLQAYREGLATSNVQRGPFGPTFSPEEDDDAQYRQELTEQIRKGLGG